MQDVIIIGGGPAGLTAMLYLRRARYNVLLIEKVQLGGQILYSEIIENYPGTGSLSGRALMDSFRKQLEPYSPDIVNGEVLEVFKHSDNYEVKLRDKSYYARCVIVASGAKPKLLGVPGELELTGRGVSYCATCDGPLFADREIVVVGGGDTAVKEALFLTKYVSKIHLIHRRDKLRAEKIYQEKLLANPKVNILWNCVLASIKGEGFVDQVTIQDIKTEMYSTFDTNGVFVFVGIDPNTGFVDCDKDSGGFIVTDNNLHTSIPGLFCAGDSRVTGLRQVATAVGDGAMAATSAQHFLEG